MLANQPSRRTLPGHRVTYAMSWKMKISHVVGPWPRGNLCQARALISTCWGRGVASLSQLRTLTMLVRSTNSVSLFCLQVEMLVANAKHAAPDAWLRVGGGAGLSAISPFSGANFDLRTLKKKQPTPRVPVSTFRPQPFLFLRSNPAKGRMGSSVNLPKR